jgi:hypothetical protein
MHTESDLRIYLTWCAEWRLDPLTMRRAHVEMYVRWLQRGPPVPALNGVAVLIGAGGLVRVIRNVKS